SLSGGTAMLRQALLGVTVLFAGAAPALGQEVTLKWKFKQGETFYVEDVLNSRQSMSVLGQQQEVEQKTTTVTSYTVKKVTSDQIVLDMKIEDVEVRSKGGLGGAFEKIMEKTRGATFTVTITPDGKVQKFEGFGDFAKKLVGGDEEAAKMIKAFLT